MNIGINSTFSSNFCVDLPTLKVAVGVPIGWGFLLSEGTLYIIWSYPTLRLQVHMKEYTIISL